MYKAVKLEVYKTKKNSLKIDITHTFGSFSSFWILLGRFGLSTVSRKHEAQEPTKRGDTFWF